MKAALLIASFLTGTAAAQTAEMSDEQLAEVTFQVGSAHVPVTAVEKLGDVVAWGLANPDGVILVHGHADERGTTPSNAQLSLARAQTVRAELERYGVNPDQIVIAAYGSTGASRRVVIWGTADGKIAAERRPRRRDHVSDDRARAGLWRRRTP